jgi:hypothetical protein
MGNFWIFFYVLYSTLLHLPPLRFHGGCWDRIQNFSIPDPGTASKNLSIVTQKIISKLSEIEFLPIRIPDPGVKKAPDPNPQQLPTRKIQILLVLSLVVGRPR